jgi:hypothetical protein
MLQYLRLAARDVANGNVGCSVTAMQVSAHVTEQDDFFRNRAMIRFADTSHLIQ